MRDLGIYIVDQNSRYIIKNSGYENERVSFSIGVTIKKIQDPDN